ncbi:Protein similar to CwfJ C-terminus 2 [Geosmithia morbida]|uniref:Protein similar to CwfJ C-terminus 2 n=1 Tax=Geosmithia morbida TaxID=1094350 RepID=A0A9P4YW40_9HYPO|nr:Protein similar to CwfJ C-terminus 2 [Geosmithia morbida]KAF4123930.1 Protein similar to CwfJ C-terminus 2 [Geosmithia morbida]
MAAPKIIVLGSLNGDNLSPALKKLATLHSKNRFTLAILTGDVFSPATDDATITALMDGTLEVPLPTYFTVGNHELPARIAAKVEADEDVCANLHFLGKRSVTKTSEGIRIVALGGRLDARLAEGKSQDQHLPFHTADDARSLRGANSADILLTSVWPARVWTGTRATAALQPDQQASIQSTDEAAELCAALRPRYHISASPGPFFYEREPFVHPPPPSQAHDSADAPVSVTRFISMAPYGNAEKAKAMYAFTLNRSDTSIPPGVTSSPFTDSSKKHAREDAGYSRFGNHHDSSISSRGVGKRRRHASPPPGPDRCYFCLSNPNLSSHMCCTIGDDAYVTVAKGPLPTSSTFSDRGLDFPGHLIIIPLPHAPTISAIPGDEAARTYREMDRFREAIQAMVASRSSHRLGLVTWEISRARNVHLIWQLVPVPADMIRSGMVEAAFKVEAENQNLPVPASRTLGLADLAGAGDFFRVWLWSGSGDVADNDDVGNKTAAAAAAAAPDAGGVQGKSLVMPLSPDQRFDLQFGRRVLAKLMGLEDRLIWKDCAQTEAEETRDVEAFREAFKDWDFTS